MLGCLFSHQVQPTGDAGEVVMLDPALQANVQMCSHRGLFMASEAAEKESPKQLPRMCVVVSSPRHANLSLPGTRAPA
jgi:hypothetical protein